MLLEGKELCLIYDMDKEQEVYALRDVDITLDKGELLGVMGPSGSGKSSLLYVLSGLKKPMSGTVYYKDTDIQDLSLLEQAKLRKNEFGFIFQKHFLIDYLTVFDNILVGTNRDEISRNRAFELMDGLGIRHLAKRKPVQLSGGQRQRIAIARALANRPSVIFADEPTASLDHKNAMEVMNILEEFRGETAIMVVTHDRSILENANRVIEMWDGRIKVS
ncbi:MAG: ABC transporter ATP-binding protein [Clostridia bacterium]|nr:ABC transporter ATP-binding protein [Clostridia bacterium]